MWQRWSCTKAAQTIEALAHVGSARRQPYARSTGTGIIGPSNALRAPPAWRPRRVNRCVRAHPSTVRLSGLCRLSVQGFAPRLHWRHGWGGRIRIQATNAAGAAHRIHALLQARVGAGPGRRLGTSWGHPRAPGIPGAQRVGLRSGRCKPHQDHRSHHDSPHTGPRSASTRQPPTRCEG